MNYPRSLSAILSNKFLPLWIYTAGLLAVITTPIRLTDHTHEIQLIGSAWFRGGSIPLVQAYSNFGPINLFLGAQYDRYITNGFTIRLFEALLFTVLALLAYRWLCVLHQKQKLYQNTLLILGLLVLTIPGVWQVGINPGKLGMVLLVGMYYALAKWQSSGKSYWLFGETSKNWRWLLLCGLMLSALIFTSLLITLFAIPIIVQFIKIVSRNWQFGLKQTLFLILPVFLQGWLWYSYFASRSLLTEWVRAIGLDFRLAVDGTDFNLSKNMVIVFPALALIYFAVLAIQRSNFKSDRHTWLIGIGIFSALFLTRGSFLLTLPLVFLLAAQLYLKNLNTRLLIVWCLAGLVFVLPYRYFDAATANISRAQAEVALVYVEQRLIDTNQVLYYGRGAGFFSSTDLSGSSRLYNSAIFPFDNESLGLVDKFRGDNEANAPLFVIYATESSQKVGDVPRIEEYFVKHYDETARLDGYKILKRK